MILCYKCVVIGSDYGIFVVFWIIGYIEMVIVSFVLDYEVVVLGLVDFFVIFNIFYFEGVWFLG